MDFLIYLLSGFIGLYFHWYIRYVQYRTDSTFGEYMMSYKQRTLASCMSIFASSALIFANAPIELSLQTILFSFASGYTLDSMTNKDKPQF